MTLIIQIYRVNIIFLVMIPLLGTMILIIHSSSRRFPASGRSSLLLSHFSPSAVLRTSFLQLLLTLHRSTAPLEVPPNAGLLFTAPSRLSLGQSHTFRTRTYHPPIRSSTPVPSARASLLHTSKAVEGGVFFLDCLIDPARCWRRRLVSQPILQFQAAHARAVSPPSPRALPRSHRYPQNHAH